MIFLKNECTQCLASKKLSHFINLFNASSLPFPIISKSRYVLLAITLINKLIDRKFWGINIEKNHNCIPRYLYKPALHCVPVLTPAASVVEKLDQRKTI